MGSQYVVRVELVESPGPDDMRVSPRMASLLARAAEIGRTHTGSPLVGTETVLRALADEPEGIAGQVLEELGVRAKARRRLDEILSDPKYCPGVSRATTA
jgi:hypothetical protein